MAVKYEWQVKNDDGGWDKISGETAYDTAAPQTRLAKDLPMQGNG